MLIQLLFVMLAAVNIAAYFLMWKDKVRAVRHGWRISENTFFLLSLLGGFIAVYVLVLGLITISQVKKSRKRRLIFK